MIKKLVNIPEDLYKKLEEKAEKEEVNLSVVIRDALFVYLNPSKNKQNLDEISQTLDEISQTLDKNELNLAKKEEKVVESKTKRILKKK